MSKGKKQKKQQKKQGKKGSAKKKRMERCREWRIKNKADQNVVSGVQGFGQGKGNMYGLGMSGFNRKFDRECGSLNMSLHADYQHGPNREMISPSWTINRNTSNSSVSTSVSQRIRISRQSNYEFPHMAGSMGRGNRSVNTNLRDSRHGINRHHSRSRSPLIGEFTRSQETLGGDFSGSDEPLDDDFYTSREPFRSELTPSPELLDNEFQPSRQPLHSNCSQFRKYSRNQKPFGNELTQSREPLEGEFHQSRSDVRGEFTQSRMPLDDRSKSPSPFNDEFEDNFQFRNRNRTPTMYDRLKTRMEEGIRLDRQIQYERSGSDDNFDEYVNEEGDLRDFDTDSEASHSSDSDNSEFESRVIHSGPYPRGSAEEHRTTGFSNILDNHNLNSLLMNTGDSNTEKQLMLLLLNQKALIEKQKAFIDRMENDVEVDNSALIQTSEECDINEGSGLENQQLLETETSSLPSDVHHQVPDCYLENRHSFQQPSLEMTLSTESLHPTLPPWQMHVAGPLGSEIQDQSQPSGKAVTSTIVPTNSALTSLMPQSITTSDMIHHQAVPHGNQILYQTQPQAVGFPSTAMPTMSHSVIAPVGMIQHQDVLAKTNLLASVSLNQSNNETLMPHSITTFTNRNDLQAMPPGMVLPPSTVFPRPFMPPHMPPVMPSSGSVIPFPVPPFMPPNMGMQNTVQASNLKTGSTAVLPKQSYVANSSSYRTPDTTGQTHNQKISAGPVSQTNQISTTGNQKPTSAVGMKSNNNKVDRKTKNKNKKQNGPKKDESKKQQEKEVRILKSAGSNVNIFWKINPVSPVVQVTVSKLNGQTLFTVYGTKVDIHKWYKDRIEFKGDTTKGLIYFTLNKVHFLDQGTYMASYVGNKFMGPTLTIQTDVKEKETAPMYWIIKHIPAGGVVRVFRKDGPVLFTACGKKYFVSNSYKGRVEFNGDTTFGLISFNLYRCKHYDTGTYMASYMGEEFEGRYLCVTTVISDDNKDDKETGSKSEDKDKGDNPNKVDSPDEKDMIIIRDVGCTAFLQWKINPESGSTKVTVRKKMGDTLFIANGTKATVSKSYKSRIMYKGDTTRGLISFTFENLNMQDRGTYVASYEGQEVDGPRVFIRVKLYIGNLPYNTKISHVKSFFEGHGINIKMKHQYNANIYCSFIFVRVDAADYEKAIALDGKLFNGKDPIHIARALSESSERKETLDFLSLQKETREQDRKERDSAKRERERDRRRRDEKDKREHERRRREEKDKHEHKKERNYRDRNSVKAATLLIGNLPVPYPTSYLKDIFERRNISVMNIRRQTMTPNAFVDLVDSADLPKALNLNGDEIDWCNKIYKISIQSSEKSTDQSADRAISNAGQSSKNDTATVIVGNLPVPYPTTYLEEFFQDRQIDILNIRRIPLSPIAYIVLAYPEDLANTLLLNGEPLYWDDKYYKITVQKADYQDRQFSQSAVQKADYQDRQFSQSAVQKADYQDRQFSQSAVQKADYQGQQFGQSAVQKAENQDQQFSQITAKKSENEGQQFIQTIAQNEGQQFCQNKCESNFIEDQKTYIPVSNSESTIWVGNLSSKVFTSEVERFFCDRSIPVSKVWKLSTERFALVDLVNPSQVSEALAFDGERLAKHRLKIRIHTDQKLPRTAALASIGHEPYKNNSQTTYRQKTEYTFQNDQIEDALYETAYTSENYQDII